MILKVKRFHYKGHLNCHLGVIVHVISIVVQSEKEISTVRADNVAHIPPETKISQETFDVQKTVEHIKMSPASDLYLSVHGDK